MSSEFGRVLEGRRKSNPQTHFSLVPLGLDGLEPRTPALKRWAIFIALFVGSRAIALGGDGLLRCEFSQAQMGVPFRIILYAKEEREAEAAAAAAFHRVETLNAILSDYEYDSELSRLSRTAGSGQFIPVSDDLWVVLERSQTLARLSDGAFDVTIGPATSLWRKARREKSFPSEAHLEMVRDRVGFRHLILSPKSQSAKLSLAHMRLDLGGIAKGYALDQAADVIQRRGFSRFMIEAGGDMVLGAPPPDKPGWTIQLDLPERESRLPRPSVVLANQALAASGDFFQYVELNGKRYSHVVDPRTCVALTNQSLVYVLAEDGLTADSLATTLSVMGTRKGLELLKHFEHSEARIAKKSGAAFEVAQTEGFPESH